ncbi:MAG: hypothetical protein P1V81_08935 [Planctomycetota bacterium]|nr:hypothetical protein [Planctomycetota bacterium]
MPTPLRILAVAALFAAPAAGQFESSQQLIPSERSSPIPGIPRDGLWTSQFYIGIGGGFFGDDEDGWLDTVQHDRITWREDQAQYAGMLFGRAMALGSDRYLIERELLGDQKTWVTILEWSGPELHLFQFDTDAGSAFERHLQARGVSVIDEVVSGDRDRILDALRSLPLEDELNERYRRPSTSEMALIWNLFELKLWYERNNATVLEIEDAFPRLGDLGQLHTAHEFASNAVYSDLASTDSLSFSSYQYSSLNHDRVRGLYDRSSDLVARIEQRIETRMAWLAEEVEVLEHREKVLDPDARFDWVSRPRPGQLLELNVKITTQDGTVIEDTRASGEPWVTPLMGELPEGLQYALRILGFEERMTVRIPARLAFGEEYGDVDVDLEIIRSIKVPLHRPPIEGILRADLAPVDATETPSGLLFRQLTPGEGPKPTRGQKVELGIVSWNAFGEPLTEAGTQTVVLGSDELFAGVNEAVAAMQVGEERVLFLPRHLAAQDPGQAGMAQCVVVQLIGLVE